MFRRLLIANRGEVAARVVRTARRLGIEPVVVASTADQDQAWLADAAEVVVIGPPRAAESYLDQAAILEVARRTRCAAIHPGWGFLAENDVFAARCAAAGVTFVGPSPSHIRAMGDKDLARRTMRDLGLDPIPGSRDALPDVATARRVADEVGYPVLLKAVSGGGGRGMRAVDAPGELAGAYAQAQAEATSAFGDGRLYLERRIQKGRHVEVQVIADAWGNVVVLGERECSLQRRHQKVVEEGPSPGLSDEERGRILPRVAEAIRASGYTNAGTVEMLLDQDGRMWFMEMNTRLQVEHPVTELLTGVDLVELQLMVAAGAPLPLTQADVQPKGHAIECRINAEDPADGFRPCPGTVSTLRLPEGEGVRVDTHLSAGDRIPPFYDAMVAKVLTWGPDRPAALQRMRDALARTEVGGVTTNLALHQQILSWKPFVDGHYDVTSLESDLLGA